MLQNRRKKGKARIAVFSVCILLLISFIAIPSVAEWADDDALGTSLGISEQMEVPDGDPNSDPSLGHSQPVEVEIREEGTLADGDLQLVLTIAGEVYQVEMIDPDGAAEEKDVPQPDSDVSLPEETPDESDSDQDADIADISPNISLFSASGENNPVLGQSGDPDAAEVSFAAPTVGTYTFNLYDSEGVFVKQLSYIVTMGLYPGAVELKMVDGENFNLRNAFKMQLSYTPQLSGKEEVVQVTLPPYFVLSNIPSSTSDYTVSSESVVMPTADYADPSDATLLAYTGTTSRLATRINITFKSNVTQMMTMTFTMSVSSSSNYTNLTRVMMNYGADADKVPLKVIARAISPADNNQELDVAIYKGSSLITEADNVTPLDNPVVYANFSANRSLSYNYNNSTHKPYVSLSNTTVLSMAAWHYPIYNIYSYVPLPSGVSISYTGHEIVDIGGNDYAKIPLVTTSPTSINSSLSQSGYSASYYLPDIDELTPGATFPFGQTYFSYTFRGVEYGPISAYNFNDHTVPAFTNAYTNFQQFNATNAGVSGSSGAALQRLQDVSDDIILFRLYNASNNSYMTAVYEDAMVTFDFPYEVSPTKMVYTKGYNNTAIPDRVGYFVYGDATERTLTPASTDTTIVFPEGADGHVTKVIFYYDVLPSMMYSNLAYTVTATNASKDAGGSSLPEVQPVSIKMSLTTASGNRTEQYATSSPNYTPISLPVTTVNYNLVGLSDSLRFGTRKSGSADSSRYYKMNDVLLDNSSVAATGWYISLKKSTAQMKDYDDVVINLKPKTAADLAGFSKMTRISFGGLSAGSQSSIREVWFKTNLDPNWRQAPSTAVFDLTDGEYPIEVEVRLGTLYGSKMVAELTNNYDTGEGVYAGNNHFIYPYFDNYRTYFTGSAEEEEIKPGDTWEFVATMSTSSTAKHINAQSGTEFYNDTSTGELGFTMYQTGYINYSSSSSTTSWSNSTATYYQGSNFTFSLYNSYSSNYVPPSGYFNYIYDLYLEANPDFEITGVTGFTLKNVTTLASGNRLYAFEGTFAGPQSYFYIQAYVRPDASLTSVGTPVLMNAGFSMDRTIQEELQPDSGDDAYYNKAPYYKLTISAGRSPFPAEWNNTTNTFQHRMLTESTTKVKIDMALLDKVTVSPTLSGAIQIPAANFKEHQSGLLGVRGFMGNATASDILKYEAMYILPRAGETTPSVNEDGTNVQLTNDYSLYLTAPIVFGNTGVQPDNLKITYYAGNTVVNITDSSTQAELRSVTSFRVYWENFKAQTTETLLMSVETDYVKKGTVTQDLFAYVGAASRKHNAPGGDINNASFVYTEAGKFVYQSYQLTVNTGWDLYETGQRYTWLYDLAEISVYYDDNGTSTLLETKTAGYPYGYQYTFSVNSDVKEVTAAPISGQETLYKLSVQSQGNANSDSDFPRDGTPLAVDINDLISSTGSNKYDALFIKLPKIYSLPTITLTAGNTTTMTPTIRYMDNNSVNSTAYSYYTLDFSPTVDPSIATIAPYSPGSKTAMITAMKKGTTTYTLTVTNRLGDTVTGTGTIVVNPYYTGTATIQKSLEAGSQLLNSSDTFNFKIWTDPANKKSVNSVRTTSASYFYSTIERGEKHYIQEDSKAGYLSAGYTVTSDGTPLTVTAEADGSYSFTVPDNANTVQILAINRNTTVQSATIQKAFDTGNVKLNASDTFDFAIDTVKSTSSPVNVTAVSDSAAKSIGGMLERGKQYYIQETTATAGDKGYTSTGFTITHNGGTIAVQPEGDGIYSFVVPIDVQNLVIVANNANTHVYDATITKVLEAGSTSGTETFTFDVWTDKASAGTRTVSGVAVGTPKASPLTFEKGVKNYIKETGSPGFAVIGLAVTSDGSPLTVTAESDGSYSFVVPANSVKLEVTATNRNVSGSVTLKKVFDGVNLDPNQQYTIKITDSVTNQMLTTEQLKENETAAVTGLIYGRTYILEESQVTGYYLDAVEILTTGGEATGTQPVMDGVNDYKYTFVIYESTNNTVLQVTNAMSTGVGFELTNYVETKGLPMETFTYKLAGDNGYTFYGRVLDTESNSSKVKWYLDSTFATATNVVEKGLPLGDYTVTHTGSNQNFVLRDFTVSSGTATGTAANLTFSVLSGGTTNVNAVATHVTKKTGSVTLQLAMDITDFRSEDFKFNLTYLGNSDVYSQTLSVLPDASNYDPVNGLVYLEWYLPSDSTDHQGSLPLGNYRLEVANKTTTHFTFDGFKGQTGVTLSENDTIATFQLNGAPGKDSITLKATASLITVDVKLTTVIEGGDMGTLSSNTFHYDVYRWDGTAGTLVSTITGLTNTVTPSNTSNTVTLSAKLPFGKYYLVQRADDSFNLLDTPSEGVITQGSTATAADVLNIDGGGKSFMAVNILKSSQMAFRTYKVAPEAGQVSVVNTFQFELYRATGNTLLFTGEAKSNAVGITSGGAAVEWTKVGTVGTLGSGNVSIKDLPYGEYIVKEVGFGDDFKAKDSRGSAGFGSKVSASEYRFVLGPDTEMMAENTVIFENVVLQEGTLDLTKTFQGGNPFPGTTFTFELRNTNTGEVLVGETGSDNKVAQWVSRKDGTVYPSNKLPFGEYYITELSDVNYDFVSITPGTIDLNSVSKKETVVAVNKAKTVGALNILKQFERDYNIGGAFTLELYGPMLDNVPPATPTVITIDGTGSWKNALSGLTYGRYELLEKAAPGYEFISISDGASAANEVDKRISFTIGAKPGQSGTANVVTASRVASTGSFTLSKRVDGNNPLKDVPFALTLTDALGGTRQITLKADESVVVDKLLLGNIQISETPSEDFIHDGFEVNGGAIQAVNPVSVTLTAAGGVMPMSASDTIVSVSQVKQDASLTFDVQMSDDVKVFETNTAFEYQVYRSLDGGATWEIPSGSLYNSVKLKENESHTYTGLLRGAVYKVVNERPASASYRVKDIFAGAGTVIDAQPEQSLFTFRPMGSMPDGSATFLMDLKRFTLSIDKYYLSPKDGKAVGARFSVTRSGSDVALRLIGSVDGNGELLFPDLIAGTYTVSEIAAPYRAIILQRDHTLTIYNDPSTGELVMKLEGTGNKGSVSGNILSIPNDYDEWKGEEGKTGPDSSQNGGGPGGPKWPDREETGEYLSREPSTTIITDEELPGADGPGGGSGTSSISDRISLPSTGGFPIGMAAVLGGVLLATGALVRRREKKTAAKDMNYKK